MKTGNQISARPFSISRDISPLLVLYAASEATDHTGMQVDDQAIRDQLELPGHDPSKDRWVIDAPDDPSTLIASSLVRVSLGGTTAEANMIVHPSWRRRGLGSLLLSRIIERARQLNASGIQIFADNKLPAAKGFLQKHGFSPQGAYTELRLDQAAKLPPIIWPYGYQLRPYSEVQDISILTQAMNLSYVLLWGHHEVSENEMTAWLPQFNQQGLFLVFSEKGRAVGISRTEPSPQRSHKNQAPTGYIDAPGIVPQHRRLDLYRALLLTGVDWLRTQGQSIIEMESWGDKREVLNNYHELGFKDIRQLVCYQYPLSADLLAENSGSLK
jgi:mycothiol synthase